MKDNKMNSRMRALGQLRELVQELMDEDFKSDKMPRLMAMKVTKVEPEVEVLDEEMPKEEMGLELKEDMMDAPKAKVTADGMEVLPSDEKELPADEDGESESLKKLRMLLKTRK